MTNSHPKPQKFDELTPEKLEFVHRMKNFAVHELNIDDPFFTLYHAFRFCAAREFVEKDVRHLLTDYAHFRTEKSLRGVIASPCTDTNWQIAQELEDGFYYIDKKFRPVFVFRIGAKKLAKTLDKFGYQAIEDYYVQIFERFLYIILPICSAAKGKRVTKCITIMDLKDVSVTKYLKGKENEFLKNISRVSQNFYPQILKRVYLINAPTFFETAWKIIKIFLHPTTSAKFKIFNNVPSKILQNDVGINNLHVLYSGERREDFFTCPGPWSPEFQRSLCEKKLVLTDPSPFLAYFCTQEEKEILKSVFFPSPFVSLKSHTNPSPKTEENLEDPSKMIETDSNTVNALNFVEKENLNEILEKYAICIGSSKVPRPSSFAVGLSRFRGKTH